VNLFRGLPTGHSGPIQKGDPADVVSKLDSALTAIFNEDGKRTVLYYMSSRYGLSLEQATADPSKLEKALSNLLGEIGWMVVKRAILEQFWDRKIPVDEVKTVERASLQQTFGFVSGLGLFSQSGPAH
jgi:hypothetical protein